MTTGLACGALPDCIWMIAAAATLACWLAMWPLLGISGAIWIESPSTWMLACTFDS